MLDQLAWGLIEAPRSGNPVLIVQKSALDTVPNEFLSQLDAGAQNRVRDSMQKSGNHVQDIIWETASASGGGGGPPLQRRATEGVGGYASGGFGTTLSNMG
jgi:hypothetical protein